MGEVDWGALAGEVGLDPPPPHPPPRAPVGGAAAPMPGGLEGVDPELLRRIQELNDMLPPGAKLNVNLPAAGSGLSTPLSTPPPQPAAAGATQLPAAPAAPPPMGGTVDWNALAGEVGLPAVPAAAPPPSALGSTIAAGMGMQGLQGNPLDAIKQGLEHAKLPESMTLAGAPGAAPSGAAAARAAALAARGIPSMSAVPEQPSFPHRVVSALHDYFSAQLHGDTPQFVDAKRRLSDEVVQVARAGGTAWNGLIETAKQVPEVAEAIKDSAMGLLGGVTASAAGAMGMPGATPDVVKAELARSRAGTEKAGQAALGLAAAPVDPWVHAAIAGAHKIGLDVIGSDEDAKKFGQMLEADPITTIALMVPGANMLRKGIAAGPGTLEHPTFGPEDFKPPAERKPYTGLGEREGIPSIVAPETPQDFADLDASIPKARPSPAEEARIRANTSIPGHEFIPGVNERRAMPTEGPRKNLEEFVNKAETVTDYNEKKAAFEEARRAVYDEVERRRQQHGIAPNDVDTIFAESPRLQDLNQRLQKLDYELAAPTREAAAKLKPISRETPKHISELPTEEIEAELARRKAGPAQQAGEPGQTTAGAGVEQAPGESAPAPAPNLGDYVDYQGQRVRVAAKGEGARQETLMKGKYEIQLPDGTSRYVDPGELRPLAEAPKAAPKFTLVSHQEFPGGKSLTYWKADQPLTIGDRVYPAGRSMTEGEIRRAGHEPPTRPGAEAAQPEAPKEETALLTKRGAGGAPVMPSQLSDRQLGALTEEIAGKLQQQRRHVKEGGAVIGGGGALESDFAALNAEQSRRFEAKRGSEAPPVPGAGELAPTKGPSQAIEPPAAPTEHAVGESLRYGKQRVVVREQVRGPDGDLVGYRVKAKGDKPFVIKPGEAKPWGDIVSKKAPGRQKIGGLTHEDLGNSEVVARFIQENGGLRETGETRDLGRSFREQGLMGVVRKDGLEIDDMAERLADDGAFRDKDHAADWLNDWIYNAGEDKIGPTEGTYLDRVKSQGSRFGVEIPERRARLAGIGRDTNPLVANPAEGQKGNLKKGDVVMLKDDVFRVKADPQNPGKLMLKDGRTIRPAEGQSIEGVKVGRMPIRTREQLRAAGRPVPPELRTKEIAPKSSIEPTEGKEAPFGEESGPDPYEELKGRVEHWKEIDSMLIEPSGEKPNKELIRLWKDHEREKLAIELEFDEIRKKEGGDAEEAVRESAGWPERNEDVLAEARRKTDLANLRAEKQKAVEEKRKKDVGKGQRSMIDEETTDAIEREAEAKEREAEFDEGQGGLFGYPTPQEGTPRAAARPIPLEKDLKPKRPEAVIRAQDIKRRFERAVLAPIRYGIGRHKALGFFKPFERIIRTKKYLDLPVDFHEGGHAIQQLLWPEINQISGKQGFNIKGPNSSAMRAELSKLGHALYDPVGRKPVGGYKSEGLAEFVRLYIEDRAKAKAEAPVFFEEFKRRLLQDADTVDLGRMLDETAEAWKKFREQSAVAKTYSRLSIGETGPRRPMTLDRVSSAMFENQKFIESWTKALNGGLRPEFDLHNPITHAHMLRGWTGLAENTLRKGGGVADISEKGTFEPKGPSYYDIVRRPGVADKPLQFVNEAVRAYEKMSPAERVLRGFTNVFTDANNMRGLDTLRVYRYARRVKSIAEGDVARKMVNKSQGALSDAEALRIVQRNPKLVKEGMYRDAGISYAEAKQVIKDLETPELKKAVDDLTTWSNQILHWYVEEGMWTADQYRKVTEHPANLTYMPLQRAFSEYGQFSPGFHGRSISGARPEVRRLKGSDIPIVDPIESDIAAAYLHAQAVQRNRAMRSIVEFAGERPGSGWASELVSRPIRMTKFKLAEIKAQVDDLIRKGGGDPELLDPAEYEAWARIYRPAMTTVKGKNIATYFVNGKEKMAEMDPTIYRAVAGLDQEAMNKFLKVFGAPARWTRAGATLTPEFLLHNLFRDPITASILSETGGINPFTGAVPGLTTVRGIRELVKNGDHAFRYRASGAAHAAMVSMDRDYLSGQAREFLSDQKTLSRILGVENHPVRILRILGQIGDVGARAASAAVHPIRTLRVLGEIGETGTRIGTFMADQAGAALSHDRILRAAVKSREGTTDFNRYGTLMEPVARTVPFLNPGIQSVRRFNIVTGRALRDIARSVQSMARGELRTPEYAARYASRVLTYVVAPSVVLHYLRKETGREDDYKELPAWRRHLFWNVPLPKGMSKTYGFNWLSIPKPFEIGVLYGTGTELMLEQMEKVDPKAIEEYKDSLVGAFMPNIIPAFLNASVENLANRKIAFDRPIMPESQKELDPSLQYGLYTSDTAKLTAGGLRNLPSLVGKPVAFAIKLSGDQTKINAYDVDNVIRSLSAGLGQYYITPAMDFVIRRLIGGKPMGERVGIESEDTTKMKASDVLALRGFIPRASEVAGGLIERTYEDIAAANAAWNTYVKLDGWRKDEYLKKPENRRLIVAHHVYDDVQAGLAAANTQIEKARKEKDEELVDHLNDIRAQMARSIPQRVQEAMNDPTADNAIAIERELSRMRTEAHARHAEAATVIESLVESKATYDQIRQYLDTMTGDDRRWATRYMRSLKDEQKLSAEREAKEGASRREKLQLKKLGMLQ